VTWPGVPGRANLTGFPGSRNLPTRLLQVAVRTIIKSAHTGLDARPSIDSSKETDMWLNSSDTEPSGDLACGPLPSPQIVLPYTVQPRTSSSCLGCFVLRQSPASLCHDMDIPGCNRHGWCCGCVGWKLVMSALSCDLCIASVPLF